MLDTVEELTGVRMKGMGGPGPQAGTENTPDLMAEAGSSIRATGTWTTSRFRCACGKGKLIAMPYSVEMNDVSALATAEADEFLENLKRQFDKLYAEGRGERARDVRIAASAADWAAAAHPLPRTGA